MKLLTNKELISLREDIVLGSLFYGDYKNSLNIRVEDAFDFFDTYLNYLGELMEYEIGHYSDEQFWDLLPKYDTNENLIDFYHNVYEYELEEMEDEDIYL